MAATASAERDAAARWVDSLAFLQALGRDPKTCRLRAFYHSQNPKKVGDKGAKGAATSANVERWQQQGRGVYVVVNPGGDKDDAITSCCAFFCEFDDRPKVDQIKFWEALGLPEPSIQVDTGGKSIHSYWVLDVPVEPERWRDIQTRLLDFANADRTLKNPSRVMRLPGTRHANERGELGAECEVINISDARYVAGDIEACLPDPVEEKKRESYREPEKRSMAEIAAALDRIPSAVPGQGQYAFYRTLLWGLIAACEEAGGGAEEAITMMKRHSPEFREVEACGRYQFSRVGPWTFWYLAKQHGWVPERPAHRVIETPKREREEEREEQTPPFTCLGFSGNDFFYQPGDSGQVMSLSAGAGHSALNLLRLAAKSHWEREYPRYNADGERVGVDWQSAVDDLTREQHSIGAYDSSRIRGIGAWMDEDRVVFHLGDRLIWGDEAIPVLQQPKGHYLYQRLPRKRGPGAVQPMGDDEGLGIAMLAERFSWQASASARLLAGWVALAPIAGALEWRPHVWVSGVAGTGKTTLVTEFVMPLLADMALFALGNTTEAGLRQTLKSDAVPVVFDEAESNTPEDARRIQSVLALARAASAQTGAHNYKGTARGEAQMYEIRSMFLLSSITTGLKEGADRTRFSALVMEQGLQGDDWARLEGDIAEACNQAAGQRLIARMVRLVPLVRQVAEQMRVVVARHLKGGSRTGQQVGALLAGWWCLSNRRPPTDEEAEAMVTGTCWREHGGEGDERGGDQGELLATLLESRLTVEVGGAKVSRTVLELCRIADGVVDEVAQAEREAEIRRLKTGDRWQPSSPAVTRDGAIDELGRNGIAVREGGFLYVANQSKGIERLLAASKWGRGEWKTLLSALPGADRAGVTRFKGLSTVRRAVSLPREAWDPTGGQV